MNTAVASEWLVVITALAVVLVCAYSIYIVWRELRLHSTLTLLYSGLLAGSIVFLGYGCLIITKHFSVDSFNEYYDIAPFFALSIGRYINSGVNLILSDIFHINQTMQQQPLIFMWCLSLIFFILGLSLKIADCMKQSGVRTLILIIAIIAIGMVNPFMMELILFPEMASPLTVANVSGCCAIFSFSEFMQEEKIRKRIADSIICTLMFLIVIGTYQEYLGILVSAIIVLILVDKKNDGIAQLKWIVVVLVYGAGASVFNVWIVSYLRRKEIIGNTGRGAELSNNIIKRNVIAVSRYFLGFIKNANGLISGKLMMPVIIAIILGIITTIITIKGVLQKLVFCLSLLGCIGLAYAPHIVESNIVLNARSTCAVWSVFSVFSVCAFYYIQNLRTNRNRNKIISYFTETFVIFFIITNVIVQQDMASNQMVTYTLDRTEAEEIVNRIEEYESTNKVEIKKIATIGDKNETAYDELSKYRDGELGKRIMATHYSNYRLINYLSNRNLQLCDVSKYVRDKAKTTDWYKFDPEQQIFFEGDTVNIIVY